MGKRLHKNSKTMNKFLLFLSAIKKSAVWIIFALFLVVMITLLLKFVFDDNDSQLIAFFVGIIASVIATIVFKVSDNYTNNLYHRNNILYQIDSFISFYDTHNINGVLNSKNQMFEIWQIYASMCQNFGLLTYQKEFYPVFVVMSDIIEMIVNNNVDGMPEKIDELKKIREQF